MRSTRVASPVYWSKAAPVGEVVLRPAVLPEVDARRERDVGERGLVGGGRSREGPGVLQEVAGRGELVGRKRRRGVVRPVLEGVKPDLLLVRQADLDDDVRAALDGLEPGGREDLPHAREGAEIARVADDLAGGRHRDERHQARQGEDDEQFDERETRLRAVTRGCPSRLSHRAPSFRS